MYDDCPQLVKDYLFYMSTIQGRSVNTVYGYYIDIRNFLKYLRYKKEKLPIENDISEVEIQMLDINFIEKITLSDTYDYLNYVMTEQNNNANTRSRKVSSMRSFFKYLTNTTHLLEVSPLKELETPSLKKSLPKYLTLEESKELIESSNKSGNARDYCIIVLFLNCGMRLSELVAINLQDIRENTLKLLGKGNKERVIYLNNSCIDAINEYIKEREQIKVKPKDINALFLSRLGSRITPRRVEQIVDEYLKDIHLDGLGYSPHKLRHTAATLLYQHGNVDVRILKELLGHVSLATTEIYTHVSNKQLENASNQSPLSAIIKDKKNKEKL